MATEPTPLLTSDTVHATASLDRVFAVVWRGTMTPAAVRALSVPIGNAARRFPGDAVWINVIEPECPVPGDDVRKAFAEIIRAQHGLRGIVVVAEGSGFRGSLVRSVVTSLALLVRAGIPLKVASSVAEGAKWVSTQGAARAGAELEREIVRVVEAARARIGAR